jgi:hypothetical protein
MGAHTFKEGSSHKWERIEDYPLHANLKTVVLQIRFGLLENFGII